MMFSIDTIDKRKTLLQEIHQLKVDIYRGRELTTDEVLKVLEEFEGYIEARVTASRT